MSIASAIQSAQQKVAAAYTACNSKGATMPAAGSQNLSNLPATINSISTGGGSAYPTWDDEPNAVELIDYDGLVLKSMSASEFLALSDYPSFPNPTGLVHAGWNWPFTKAQEYVQKYGRIEVGRLYYTDTGDTRVHITLRSLKTVLLRMNQSTASGVTIDWGDGSTVETSAASTGNITPEHTYENEGNYIIKISVTSGTLALGTTANSTTGTFLGHSGGFGQTSVVRKIEIGRGVNKFNQYALWHNFSLRTISMTPDITAIGASFLSSCHKLRCFIFPNGNTTIPNPSNDTLSFGCERYLFPPSATSIGQQGNTSTSGGRLQCVRVLTLPEIASIPNYGFFDLANVDTVAIPSTITSIGSYGFSDMWSMYNLYCYPTTPPTITSNTFRNIRSVCVIHVPAASLEAYQTATNWSTQASKMVGDL